MSSHQVELPSISEKRTTVESKSDVRVQEEDPKDQDEHEVSGKGTWKHAAFHVTTTIATPAAYAPLPFALASLGWPLGVSSLVAGTMATWYSSLLISTLWRWNGKKHVTYRLLANSIFGLWGYYSIAFFQQVASIGNNIAIQIAAGSSLKASKFGHSFPLGINTSDAITYYICVPLWVNGLCTFSTIGFAGTTIGVTIYNGKKIDRESISYSLQGSSSAKRFAAFNALGTIAFSFGDAMLPEIQNTVREPAVKNMYKGVSAAYSVIVSTYWLLACIGYWAFGSQVQPYIVASLTVPKWTIVMANIFAVIQISGCYQIYCRPTYAYLEERSVSSDTTNSSASVFRNRLVRLTFTSIYIVVVTLVASAMPFFVDFVSICGAIGFIPLDFVFPVLAFLKAGKMPKNRVLGFSMRVVNIAIAAWFSVVAVLGCIGAIRFVVEDVKTYKFFHDM
ncbi:Transmembrane amino acid transporter family protein isoform 2 [Hibiscus syriacus]|uniref:Transmembrane amino acid transporter family protein isoform 2 n=1 Tax=Hibiscus syriacus TaxID=106335 RepID=A0A6A2Z382_HIBSY|nr:Transmembrane amino acid transporter family protein isoform 2 [Hibiscus syriacus]